jgi:hypothetical protein
MISAEEISLPKDRWCLRFKCNSFYELNAVNTLPVHHLSAVNDCILRFKYSSTFVQSIFSPPSRRPPFECLPSVSRRDADLKMLCSIPLTEYFPFRERTPSTLNTPNATQLRQSCMVTPKPPSSSAMASALNSICSASRSISSVPGFPEHPHPVASQDFRDVDERVAVAYQFRAEDWEVRYLIEILDVLE